MNSTEARDQTIDIAKGIGIILIVFGHTFMIYMATSYIYSFHMPLFFFLAGYNFNLPRYQEYPRHFLRRRLLRLMLPYFGGAFCSYLIYMELAPILSLPLISVSAAVRWIIYGNGTNLPFNVVLWFLPTLFCAEIIFLSLGYMLKGFKLIIGVVSFSIVGLILGGIRPLIIGLDIAMTMQLFMYIGYMLRQARWIEKAKKSKKRGVLSGVALITLILMVICSSNNGRVDLMTRLYRQPILFFIAGLSGSISVLMISLLFSTAVRSHTGRILGEVGRASMYIFVSHTPFFYCLAAACALLWGFWIYYTFETYWYLLFFLGVAVPTLAHYMIESIWNRQSVQRKT